MNYAPLKRLWFCGSLLVGPFALAETMTEAQIYWDSDSVAQADTQALSDSKPWSFYQHTVSTSEMTRGDHAVRLGVVDNEGRRQTLVMPLYLPLEPSVSTAGYANVLRAGQLQRKESDQQEELNFVEGRGSDEEGFVWAIVSGLGAFDDEDSGSTQISLIVSDAYADSQPLPITQSLFIPEFPDVSVGGYANLITSANLERSSRKVVDTLPVSVGPVGVNDGYTWAILRKKINIASQDIGDLSLDMQVSDAFSDTEVSNYRTSLSVTSERIAGEPLITSIDAVLNGSSMPIVTAEVNGSIYVAQFAKPTALNPVNYTRLSSVDWLGERSNIGNNYFSFFDGDVDFIDDRFDPDLDNDGLTNEQELTAGTDPRNPNTDGDALSDYVEVVNGLDPLDSTDLALDKDNDGLSNLKEVELGTNVNRKDTDSDGIIDGVEVTYGLDPTNELDASFDLDKDGISNLDEINAGYDPTKRDTDNDGIDDPVEVALGLDPTNGSDATADYDYDGISNIDELALGTSIYDRDSDDDGISDGAEVAQGSDPLDAKSFVGKTITLLAFADLNGDGVQDWLGYDLTSSALKVRFFSGSDWTELSNYSVTLNQIDADLHLLADRNNDGLQELGLFYFNDAAKTHQLAVYNGESGSEMGIWSWPDSMTMPALVVLPDINGDGVQEYALSGLHKTNGTRQLFVRDGVSKERLNIHKWPNLWDGVQYVVMDDVTNDGVAEIALYGRHKRLDKGQLFVQDGSSANKLDVYNWNRLWLNISLHEMDDLDGDGTRDWGQFGQRKDDGRYQWVVKKGHSKKGVIRTFSWPADITDVTPILVSDRTQDGIREVAVFGKNEAKGRYFLRINDGQLPNQRIANISWPLSWQDAHVVELGDLSGDKRHEFALVGFTPDTRELSIVIRDGDKLNEYGKLTLSGSWESVDVRSYDVNSDGHDDIVVTGVEQSLKQQVVSFFDGKSLTEISSHPVE